MPTTPVSSELLADFFGALEPRLRGTLHRDAMTRSLYSTDASMYQMQPVGVLIPRHAEDVQAAMEEAVRFQIPVLPRGGGSSLAGQTVGEALVIDFTRHLDGILAIDPEAKTVRVQPGLVLDRLNDAVRPHGLMFGPDPASSQRATLGGMMANNATGTHSILYGNVIRHVQAVKALLADGSQVDWEALTPEVWQQHVQRQNGLESAIYRQLDRLLRERGEVILRDTPAHWRRSNGYRIEALLEGPARNLAQLLCGSEGTLAIATELTLGLVERPARTALGVVHFHTRQQALQAVTTILETEPAAVELFDGVSIEQVRQSPGFASRATFIEGDPGGILITEYYGSTTSELEAKLDHLERHLKSTRQGYGVVRLLDAAAIANVWSVRKESLGLIMSIKGDHKPIAFIEDASVPVEHLADYIDELAALLENTQTRAAMYAHASGGCLHVRPFINLKDAADIQKMRDLAWGSMELVRKYGGYVSSEHGDGLARSWLNEPLLGTDLYNIYRDVKEIFDPKGVLNPGKIVDAPEMTEHLRMGEMYTTLPMLEDLDFSADQGFAGAFELCNGCGSCRKLDTGTMCPSFMVTRDEKHTTRGRANALRNVMSGALDPEMLYGDELYEVMDLCIQCKGCKTECPSNVDMAKLKTEWLNGYWREQKMPLRTKLFAHLPTLAPYLTGRHAPLFNRLNHTKPMRWLLGAALGISKERKLPGFAKQAFHTWFRKQTWQAEGPSVVLFADTFNTYNDPHISKAAATFLHRVGYQVHVPEQRVCCGRPLISKGLVAQAQVQALQTVEALYPFAEQGMPIIGLEPSCLLTLSDEFLAMLPGDPRVQAVAEHVQLFESFIATEADAGRLDQVDWTDEKRKVLLHGHCHQKALVGTGPSEQCLSLPPNYRVETVDSGCCGMAGAFGYEKEHYEISTAMAERRLAPAVRATSPNTIIAAAGTSCRHQIHDTAAREALHPAEILCNALA